ncbi:MAG: radical SAM/SPASM domain-containing protein [Desulfovibrionales bacterium]
MKLLRKLFPPSYPELDWIQIGVTTRCNAACVYCPHAAFKDSSRGCDLSMETFNRLVPAFSRAQLIYLQGWGEPLLHPHIGEMLQIVKNKGCLAGLTSNATLLTPDKIRELVDAGLDYLSLSLAGIDSGNDAIRKGTSLKKVLGVIDEVNRIKAARKTSFPQVHLAFMLLQSSLDDLERMPAFFNSLEIDQVVISSLTMAFTPEMKREMDLAQSPEQFQDLRKRLVQMKNAVDDPEKIHFHIYNPFLSAGKCSENIHRATYMSVDGNIRPCVCTDTSDLFPENSGDIIDHSSNRLQNLSFGNIQSESLNIIWNSPEYTTFRKRFKAGEPIRICTSCTKRCIDDLR